jgi:hypothetical protein
MHNVWDDIYNPYRFCCYIRLTKKKKKKKNIKITQKKKKKTIKKPRVVNKESREFRARKREMAQPPREKWVAKHQKLFFSCVV